MNTIPFDWQLLLTLIGGYVGLCYLQNFLMQLAVRKVQRRFQTEFGLPFTDANIAALLPEESTRWYAIKFDDLDNGIYRKIEIIYAFFHYPAILVLGGILRQTTLPAWPMFFITGTTYVTIAYLLMR